MARAYKCPICRSNSEQFALVYKMAQEITKDPDSGETLFYADELETLTKIDGQPDLDVRCMMCGYVGQETAFMKEAQHSGGRR
jgi:uncharacterized Zn finger protein